MAIRVPFGQAQGLGIDAGTLTGNGLVPFEDIYPPEGKQRTYPLDAYKEADASPRMSPSPSGGALHVGLGVGVHASATRSTAKHAAIGGSIKLFVFSALSVLDYMINSTSPLLVPSTSGAIGLFLNHKITRKQLECIASINGGVWQYVENAIDASRNRPNIAGLNTLYNRGWFDPITYQERIRELGVITMEDERYFNNLRENTPSPGEMLDFASRGVLNDDASIQTGLYDEMPDGLDHIFQANGLHGVNDALPLGGIPLQGKKWSQVAWAGHWSTLGLTVINEMLHRFRPDRVNRYLQDGLNVNEFNLQDARNWYARNAIPPSMRDNVIAAGFRPLDRRVLYAGITIGEVDNQEAINILRDEGMGTADAKRYAEIMDARREWLNNAPIRTLERGIIARSFRSAERAYQVGVMDRIKFVSTVTDIGVSVAAANGYADSIDADLLAKRVESILKALKRDYLNGSMDPIELSTLLSQSGIAVDRQQQYLVEWGALRSLERRVAQTEKIIGWLVQGIMTQDVALQRLANLGWTAPDALAYIAESQLKIAKRDAAIEAAGFRNAKSNAALLNRQARQAEQQLKGLRTELRRLQPVGRLIKWYRQGSISEVYFEDALRTQGYPDSVIAEYFIEAQKDGPLPKPAKPAKLPQGSTVSPAGTGESTPISGETQGKPEFFNPPAESHAPRGPTPERTL